ncbi:hypothetical protein [Arachidicoccus sp.]|uniref:hypothetical protein n=1 Tax=Arachidicoccus sp. TaxID=1872624 RepID=UPI003D1E7621
MILGYILGGIVLYYVVRFVFNIILPILKTTKVVRQKMQDMQQPPQNPYQQNTTSSHTQKPQAPSNSTRVGDYIDFEEIKDKG